MNRLFLVAAALALCASFAIGVEPAFAVTLAHSAAGHSVAHLPLLAILAGIPMTAAERAKGRYMRDGTGHTAGGDGGRELSPEEIATELRKALDKTRSELIEIAEKAVDEANRGIGMSEGAKEKADETLIKFNELKQRFDELEQKGLRREEPQHEKSPGYQFIENDLVKAFMAAPRGGTRVDLSLKAIISSATTLADGSAGDLLVPMRLPNIVTPAQRRMTVRDLLMPGRTSQPSIQYAKETGYTNAAATVSEQTGPTKPQSDIQFDIVTAAVTTIAHFVIATKQILDDAPMLQSYIDFRLRYGLAYVEEQQLLNGSGTGTNLNGIYTQATAFAAGSTVVGATSQKLDVLRVAMLQVALAELEATGHVLNPRDWAEIELLKDTTGRYIIGDPAATGVKRLWGLPVVDTTAMTAGNFLTGAFGSGAQIFDREDANVALSTEDANNFRQNLVTILAEERIGLAVYRPEAFIKGTYSTAITDLTS